MQDILSKIVVHSKYARYNKKKKRRETWREIVDRNKLMHIKKFPLLKKEIEANYKYVYDKKVLPSMRSLQFAGKAMEVNPARGYNCSFVHVDNIQVFAETLFLLLSGTGVGISVQDHHIAKLPLIQHPSSRSRKFIIEDSIMGWADSVKVLLKSYTGKIKSTIDFDYSQIRERGAELVTSGGSAPGPEPLRIMLEKLRGMLNQLSEDEAIRPFIAHRMMCIISDAVLAGGIRRSALISLFSKENDEMLSCKTGLWWEKYPELGRANNSVVLKRNETSYDDFKNIFERLEASGAGEPGISWTNNIEYGFNPCHEVTLRSSGVCNLTEINGSAITSQQEFNTFAQVAAFIGTLQAAYTDFPYLRDVWKDVIEEDALIGVGITGIANDTLLSLDETEAAEYVKAENVRIADLIGINHAKRTTVVKPSGTSSIVLGTSSGIHAFHSEYYIRRMRIGKDEAIYKYLMDTVPYMMEDEFFRPNEQSVLSVPIKSPKGAITRSETTLDLLERTRRFNVNWVHPGTVSGDEFNNVSATVSIKDEEWNTVRDWMWVNKDSYAGISLLPFDGGNYKQTPFESISKERYVELSKFVKDIDLSNVYEDIDNTDQSGESACSGGQCEINSI